jgi:hypothetical protein
MCRSPRPSLLLAGVVLAAAPGLPAPARADAPALARLTLAEAQVEQQAEGAAWRPAVEGQPLRIGDRLRTGPAGLARLDMPWMALTVSPSSSVGFPDDFFLSAVLDAGRVVIASGDRDALKLVTPEAQIRGRGRAVVRREGERTLVSCLEGRFRVDGGPGGVWLDGGQGTVVTSGGRPLAPVATPDPPATASLQPGQDPLYVLPGDPLELRWDPNAAAFQVEILPVGSDFVLLQRDVGPPPTRVAIPWGGAFRWRVAARDERGLEGRPSGDGEIAVELGQ